MPPAGLPRDPAQWLALALALAALVLTPPLVRAHRRPRRFVALAALVALALSAAYVAVYLRGGPRIIDATSYWLEARALAQGYLAWPIEAPEPSTLGRFLVRSESAEGPRLAVIFPPGWPALLALGFLARAPLAVGPLLAAAITVATFALADRVARTVRADPAIHVPQLAVLFSLLCAALRYHTADTMAHGLAALCVTAALASAFHAVDAVNAVPHRPRPLAFALALLAGLAAGWLAATRPVSALALALPLLLAFRPLRPRLLAAAALGALPGLALLLAHQHAATARWAGSSQRLYYAVSDGPTGCFRYGFGAGIGCVGEHGDFVRAHLLGGYGPLAAAGTTLRRLWLHSLDSTNALPLALLVPLGVALAWRSPRVRLLALAIGAQILAYAPFYFDGNYPGGGARFFADVLPLEHTLIALALAALARRARVPARVPALALALSLLGFAVHAGFAHAQLRDREGGRPMFLAADLAGLQRGLVFVDTDHGFNLAFDPAAHAQHAAAHGGLEILRWRGDDLDRLAWEARGRPPAFHHRYLPDADSLPPLSLLPLAFAPADRLDIEGASLWPLRTQQGGWAFPEWSAGTCATGGRWLALHADAPGGPVTVRAALPSLAAAFTVAPRVAVLPGATGELTLLAGGAILHRWPLAAPADSPPGAPVCLDLPPAPVPSTSPARAGEILLALHLASPPFSAVSPAGVAVAGPAAPPPLALDRILLSRTKSFDP